MLNFFDLSLTLKYNPSDIKYADGVKLHKSFFEEVFFLDLCLCFTFISINMSGSELVKVPTWDPVVVGRLFAASIYDAAAAAVAQC